MTVCCLFSFLFLQSRTQGKITKLAKTEKTSRLYAADQMGYIYIHDIKKFVPSQRSQKGKFLQVRSFKMNQCSFEVIEVLLFFYIDSAENFWRAHTSRVTGYVTYTSHQQSRIVLLPHLFLPFQRIQGGEGGSKEDR